MQGLLTFASQQNIYTAIERWDHGPFDFHIAAKRTSINLGKWEIFHFISPRYLSGAALFMLFDYSLVL